MLHDVAYRPAPMPLDASASMDRCGTGANPIPHARAKRHIADADGAESAQVGDNVPNSIASDDAAAAFRQDSAARLGTSHATPPNTAAHKGIRTMPPTFSPRHDAQSPEEPSRIWVQPPSHIAMRTIRTAGTYTGLDEIGPPTGYRELERRPVADRWPADAPNATATDVIELRDVTLAVVSTRGMGRQDCRAPRQDAVLVRMVESCLVAVVADGVSHAPQAHVGAASACRAAVAAVAMQLCQGVEPPDIHWRSVTEYVRDALRRQAAQAIKPAAAHRHAAVQQPAPEHGAPPAPTAASSIHATPLPHAPSAPQRRTGSPAHQTGSSAPAPSDRSISDAQATALLGTTCEVLVVDTTPDEPFYVHATLAGDGYAYLLDTSRGISPLGGTTGSLDDEMPAPATVRPLPGDPGEDHPRIATGRLHRGTQAVLVTTDGLGDDIQDGTTDVAGYLFARLARPVPPHELVRVTGYLRSGSVNDRSAAIAWG